MSSGKGWPWKLALVLLLVGGLNWGLIGLGGFLGKDLNLVSMVLGSWPKLEWFVYLLVGLSALWKLTMWCRCGGGCSCKK